MSSTRLALGWIAWVLACFAAAASGAMFMPGEWYASIQKPPWNPPSWLFGPVWTTLYFMMATAAWLVWRQGGFAAQRRPLGWFLAQLALNAAWTPIFFGLHWMGVALLEMLLLWGGILLTINSFRKTSRPAAWLLAPYLGWVSFAAVLNFTLWRLNS